MNDPIAEKQWWFIIEEALKDPLVRLSFIIILASFFILLIAAICVSPRKERDP